MQTGTVGASTAAAAAAAAAQKSEVKDSKHTWFADAVGALGNVFKGALPGKLVGAEVKVSAVDEGGGAEQVMEMSLLDFMAQLALAEKEGQDEQRGENLRQQRTQAELESGGLLFDDPAVRREAKASLPKWLREAEADKQVSECGFSRL